MITSTKNPTIQQVRKLQRSSRARRDAGQFVIEGKRLAGEALAAGMRAETVLHTPDFEAPELLAGFAAAGAEVIPVSSAALQAASDTQTPQGILALLPLEPLPMPQEISFILVLDGLRDPGNMGTLIRTAAGAGVDAILIGPGSADPYAPKVLRGGMGGHFRIPVLRQEWDEILSRTGHMHLFLADSAGGPAYTRADFTQPCALIIGSEAHGPGQQARRIAATRIHIPMPGQMESLNAAVAGGILLFEIARQKGRLKES